MMTNMISRFKNSTTNQYVLLNAVTSGYGK